MRPQCAKLEDDYCLQSRLRAPDGLSPSRTLEKLGGLANAAQSALSCLFSSRPGCGLMPYTTALKCAPRKTEPSHAELIRPQITRSHPSSPPASDYCNTSATGSQDTGTADDPRHAVLASRGSVRGTPAQTVPCAANGTTHPHSIAASGEDVAPKICVTALTQEQ